MTYRNSAYTGRAPRTMQQAFNPYSSGPIEPMRDENDRRDRVTTRTSVLAAIALLMLLAAEKFA